MVVIRLSRAGTKKKPFYHLAVADKRSPRDGRFIERVGYYNPVARGKSEPLRVDLERIDYWVSVGAQLSPKVKSIVARARILDALPPEPEETDSGVTTEPSDEPVATLEVSAVEDLVDETPNDLPAEDVSTPTEDSEESVVEEESAEIEASAVPAEETEEIAAEETEETTIEAVEAPVAEETAEEGTSEESIESSAEAQEEEPTEEQAVQSEAVAQSSDEEPSAEAADAASEESEPDTPSDEDENASSDTDKSS